MSKFLIPPARRKKTLKARRLLKMAESAHAYVRGSTEVFYRWVRRSKLSQQIPVGPLVWICGDCHTGNLGPIADLDGNIDIQIRDLDQTVIGNPAHDLVRIALSLAMSARSLDLPGITTAYMIKSLVAGYTSALIGRRRKIEFDEINAVRKVIRTSLRRKWRHLAEDYIEDARPNIPLGLNFWPLTRRERREMRRLFEGKRERELLEVLVGDRADGIELLDAAYWVKGCSSLGRARYAALVKVNKEYRLLDIKEAPPAVYPSRRRAGTPRFEAARVVAGARALSPHLGERMLAAKFAGREVVIRELRPHDLKFDLAELTREEAVLLAELFGGIVGEAHGRQMSLAQRREWKKKVSTRLDRALSVPSWLWNAVIELISVHESDYLYHCATAFSTRRSGSIKLFREKSGY